MELLDLFDNGGKRCAYCGQYLEWWQFNRSKRSRDGLQSYCKTCQKRYREKHPNKEYKQKRKDNSLSIW